jgi:hypothetical protein
MPKFYVSLLIAIGLALLSSIWLPEDIGRTPVLAADGTPVRNSDGSILTKPDTSGYIKRHWFGFIVGMLSLLFFVMAIVRLLWHGWSRFQRSRYGRPVA